MYDIFISYRREDGKEFARQLQLKLQNLGYRTFLDVEELKDGVFDKRITDAIEASTVFLALLTPRYFCRCAEEEDWVRKEIVCAVEGKKHIVLHIAFMVTTILICLSTVFLKQHSIVDVFAAVPVCVLGYVLSFVPLRRC